MGEEAIDAVFAVIETYEALTPFGWLRWCIANGVSVTDFVQSVALLEAVHLVTLQTMINADGSDVQCYVLDKTPYTPQK
jgi:hypothetical protein